MLRALTKAGFIGKLGNNIHSAATAMTITTRTIAEIFTELLISVNQELFVERRIKRGCLRKFRNGLRLFVHSLHQEKRVLDFKRCACWELLNTEPIHVLSMLKQQLVIISVLLHRIMSLLLLRCLLLLVLHALNDAVLILLELAFLVWTLILMMIHIPFENDSVLAISGHVSRSRAVSPAAIASRASTAVESPRRIVLASLEQVKEIPNLVSNLFSALEVVNVLEKKPNSIISIKDNQSNDKRQSQKVKLKSP